MRHKFNSTQLGTKQSHSFLELTHSNRFKNRSDEFHTPSKLKSMNKSLVILSLCVSAVSAWGKKKAPEPEYSNTLEMFVGGWAAGVAALCVLCAVKKMNSKPQIE